MSRYLLFWAVWLMAGAGYEIWAVWFHPADDDTLSEFTAYVFKAGTVAGWIALVFLMGFLAAWYPAHVRRLAQRKRTGTDLQR